MRVLRSGKRGVEVGEAGRQRGGDEMDVTQDTPSLHDVICAFRIGRRTG